MLWYPNPRPLGLAGGSDLNRGSSSSNTYAASAAYVFVPESRDILSMQYVRIYCNLRCNLDGSIVEVAVLNVWTVLKTV